MTADIVQLADHRSPTEAEVNAAEAAYSAHRRLELSNPALVDDPAHVSESDRLHAIFTRLFLAEQSNVIPFRRSAR